MLNKKNLFILVTAILVIISESACSLLDGKKSNLTEKKQDLNPASNGNIGYTTTLHSPATKPIINWDPTDDNTLPRCLMMHTGEVNIEISYPNFLMPSWYLDNDTGERFNEQISLYKKNKQANERERYLVIGDYPNPFNDTTEDIIATSLIEPGPKYKKSVFNGYDAAFFRSQDEGGGVWDSYFYKIPFLDRIIIVDYNPSILTKNETILAEKMLRGITFSKADTDVKEAYVEHCGETTEKNKKL